MNEQTIVNDYFDFLKSKIHIEKMNDDYYHIKLPFCDYKGNGVSLYVKEFENGLIELHDDGYCIREYGLQNKIIDYYKKYLSQNGIKINLVLELSMICKKEKFMESLQIFISSMIYLLNQL